MSRTLPKRMQLRRCHLPRPATLGREYRELPGSLIVVPRSLKSNIQVWEVIGRFFRKADLGAKFSLNF